MSRHVPPTDNQNRPIIGVDDQTTPLCYFNHVRLKRGETFVHQVAVTSPWSCRPQAVAT